MATRAAVQNNREAARAGNAKRRVRKRKRNRTLHYILLLLFLLGAGAILSVTVLFKIQGVEVIGTEKYLPDEIIAATGIELEDNLLAIDKKEIQRALLEQFPYIESLEIRRKMPPSVEITVTQAEPIGAILQGDQVTLISASGKVLEKGILLVPEGVPIVKGIDAAGVEPGEILGAYTPPRLAANEEMTAQQKKEQEKALEIQEKMKMLQYLLVAMEESEFDQLTNVDLTDRLNMRVNYENRLVLELGSESQLVDKLVLVQYVLDHYLSDDAVGTLYATEISKRQVRFRPSPSSGVDQDDVVYDQLDGGETQEEDTENPEEGEI